MGLMLPLLLCEYTPASKFFYEARLCMHVYARESSQSPQPLFQPMKVEEATYYGRMNIHEKTYAYIQIE